MENLTFVLQGMEGADKVHDSYQAWCRINCGQSTIQPPMDSYGTTIIDSEARQLLSSFHFRDIHNPDYPLNDHGIIVEYNEKYYVILITGI